MAILLRHQIFYNQLRKLHIFPVRYNVPITNTMSKTKQEFETVKPDVMNSLMSSPKLKDQLPEVRSWLKTMFDYALTDGKHARGVAVSFGYQTLEDPEHFTENKLHTTQMLGWCLEILQAFTLIVDDFLDSSTSRRGKPCWHRLPNVGNSVINDNLLMWQCLMEVLKINFRKTPYYDDLISLINETFLYVSIGQYLDYSSNYNKEKNNLDSFTMDRWNHIVTHKTTYFSLRLPLLTALFEVKHGNKRFTAELHDICCELGKLLQTQALELANKNQRAIFTEFYGSKDPVHVNKITQLYDDLKLDKVYEKYEQKVNDDLVRRINALPRKGETHFFLEILETILQGNY